MTFRFALGASAALALAIAASPAAFAAPPSATPAPRCLDTTRIINTSVPDERTILFHMQDGSVYANHLQNSCSGLKFHGFAYVAQPPHDICANMQTIRVIDDGAICMLGNFETVTAEEKQP